MELSQESKSETGVGVSLAPESRRLQKGLAGAALCNFDRLDLAQSSPWEPVVWNQLRTAEQGKHERQDLTGTTLESNDGLDIIVPLLSTFFSSRSSMAEASSQTPATVSTPSSSAAATVTGPVSHGSQNGHDLDNSVDMDAATKAPKDRSCPFCGQRFTSSSLGRHLDLYIKPKASLAVLCACSHSRADPHLRRTPSRQTASTTSTRSSRCEAASPDGNLGTA
jgi:hypothetical protein